MIKLLTLLATAPEPAREQGAAMLGPVLFVVVIAIAIATGIWVFVDARGLGAQRGALDGGVLDHGAGAWGVCCLLLWIVVFPCYLATRPRLVAARAARQQPSATPLTYPAYAQANPSEPVQQLVQSFPPLRPT